MRNLINKLKKSPDDTALWEEFYTANRPVVYYTLYTLSGGNTDLSDELCQETFCRFIQYDGLNRLESADRIKPYLRAMARHAFIQHLRQGSRAAGAVSMEEADAAEIARKVSTLSPPDLRHDIEALLEGLTEKEWKLLELSFAGHSLSEIARRLDIRYGTAAVRLHRLKKRIQSGR